MKKSLLLLVLWGVIFLFSASVEAVSLKIYHTTDLHGNFFPFDFIKSKVMTGGFSRVSTYIKEQREQFGDDTIILLDGGDLLQGQPSVYYSNFVDTVSTHLCASVMNYIGYDAAAMGNHDIEAGHPVYDRWIENCDFPVLGANILTDDGVPYLKPYIIFERAGIKVAVIGMITQAIPAWLPENLWAGLTFADIEDTSRKLIPEIREQFNPDIIVGLFHAGVHESIISGFKESVGLEVAQNVPGYDIILCGHDHTSYCNKIANIDGDSVLVINPGASGRQISEITVKITFSGNSIDKQIVGKLENIATLEPDPDYLNYFGEQYNQVKEFVNQPLGVLASPVSVRDAWFGPSTLIDLLHILQLDLSGADISLVAPLSMNTYLEAGEVYMRDMFNLYQYENLLYTMRLTGQELLDALEYSYGLWVRQMNSAEDTMLILRPSPRGDAMWFQNPYFAFDSAAGIIYTVDVSKPTGGRIHVISMADGTQFFPGKTYTVAISSYQGSGGGNILTDGAGISREELRQRIVSSTDKDLRYYLAMTIKEKKIITPRVLNQWRFIPEEWVKTAAAREAEWLYGN